MFEVNILPAENRSDLENELDPHEELLWTGQPKMFSFVAKTLPLFFFAIPWTAFAVFWVLKAYGSGNGETEVNASKALFGLPFVLLGIWMLSLPIWEIRKAEKTMYAVTNKRAIIIFKGFSLNVQSFDSKSLQNISKRIRPDGSGDLIFKESYYFDSDGDRRRNQIGFIGIEDVRNVEKFVMSIREADRYEN